MGEHTPGPWHRNIKPARKYSTVFAGRNTHIASVVAGAPLRSGNGETMSDDELEANINLIAAAPDLLEALQGIEHFGDAVAHRADPLSVALRGWIEAGRVAIAKAKGVERDLTKMEANNG